MSGAQSEIKSTEAHDSEAAQEKSGSAWLIWTVIVLLFAYPLSIGPAARHYGNSPPAAVRAFYMPLGIAYDRNKGVRQALDWYAGLWGAHL